MVQADRLGICIDESFGSYAAVLRRWRAPGGPAIHDVDELGLRGTSDEVLLSELGERGFTALIAKDSSMLNASIRRDVWRSSKMSVFLPDGNWGNLSLFETARRLFWYWPFVVQQIQEGPQGSAWRLSVELRPGGLRRIFGDHA